MEELRKKIISMINRDPDGLRRFLQSSAYTDGEYYTLNGLITPEAFLEYLYSESQTVKERKEEISALLNNPGGKNTVFLLGYQGCGKTTFVNALITDYLKSRKLDNRSKLVIDCDKYAVSSNEKPLSDIFALSLLKYAKSHDQALENFTTFYHNNYEVTSGYASSSLYAFHRFIIDFISTNKSLLNPPDNEKVKNFVIKKLDMRDMLYLHVFFALSAHYNEHDSVNPVIVFIDNLDCIDNYDELQRFLKAVDDFTFDMSKEFRNLKLFAGSDTRYNYDEKIKIVMAMRETTRAQFPNSHFSDILRTLYKHYDMTEWYEKDEIVRHRLAFIFDDAALSKEKRHECELTRTVIEDNYTKEVFMPLFNNNYRRVISVIATILSSPQNKATLEEYETIMHMQNTPAYKQYKHGARGIIFKFILDEFNSRKGSDVSCFRKIGVLDLRDRRNNDVSICRIILSFLSNQTETRCDDTRNCVPVEEIIEILSPLFKRSDIMNSIWNMYELKDSQWSHLVTFSQIEKDATREKNKVLDRFDDLDAKRTTVHYSCAGKIYLETVTTHFEYFSTRIFKDNYNSLFCRSNRVLKDREYLFIHIINSVYVEVKNCCKSLSTHNKRLCEEIGFGDPYPDDASSNLRKYLESDYVTLFKRQSPNDKFKQFHEERMIIAHIRYIDVFRLYILNTTDYSHNEKVSINKKFMDIMNNYVTLLGEVLIRDKPTRNDLLPEYKRHITLITMHPDNFTQTVTKEDNW